MKKIFITGSGSGLGKEAAIALARRGHTVYASVHYEEQISPLIQIAEKENLDLRVLLLDILDPEQRKKLSLYDIDVFIANSAIGNSGSVADVPIDYIRSVFETNVFCNLSMIQLAIKTMLEKQKHGRIIILSSLVGRIPMPFLSPYCASKFALEGFGTCLKQEMKLLKKLAGTNIQVCLIEPGAYATGFNKENNEKKYQWMGTDSYFAPYVNWIQKKEVKVWNFLEQKPYTSIIRRYVKAVESNHPHFRYSAPWWQTMFVQFGRVLGM